MSAAVAPHDSPEARRPRSFPDGATWNRDDFTVTPLPRFPPVVRSYGRLVASSGVGVMGYRNQTEKGCRMAAIPLQREPEIEP